MALFHHKADRKRRNLRVVVPCLLSPQAPGNNLPNLRTSSSSLAEFIQRRAKPFQARFQAFRVAADANAKVLRHFKKASRDDGRLVLFSQQTKKIFGAATCQSRKYDCSG